jgi:hypothetical protein
LDFSPYKKGAIRGFELENNVILVEILKVTGYHRQRINVNGPMLYFGVSNKQIENTEINT